MIVAIAIRRRDCDNDISAHLHCSPLRANARSLSLSPSYPLREINAWLVTAVWAVAICRALSLACLASIKRWCNLAEPLHTLLHVN